MKGYCLAYHGCPEVHIHVEALLEAAAPKCRYIMMSCDVMMSVLGSFRGGSSSGSSLLSLLLIEDLVEPPKKEEWGASQTAKPVKQKEEVAVAGSSAAVLLLSLLLPSQLCLVWLLLCHCSTILGEE